MGTNGCIGNNRGALGTNGLRFSFKVIFPELKTILFINPASTLAKLVEEQ